MIPEPRGALTIRTLAMPADTNPAGDIFGGWVLSQMDIAGSLAAVERAHGRAPPSPSGHDLHRPVKVGDILCVYTRIERPAPPPLPWRWKPGPRNRLDDRVKC